MPANSVCRVCLVDNVNLYSVQNNLQNVYERIAKEKYNKVGYPVHMCYICLAVLRKCHRLMETARDTNNVLKQWYNQQNEERVARPLFTYSISKVDVVSTYNGNISLQHVIKMEEVDLGVDEVQLDDLECSAGVDLENTDLDEQTDHCELLVDNDNTYTIEYNYDKQTDRYNKKIDFEETSSIVSNLDVHTIETISLHDNDTRPIKRRKTNKTKPQHQVSETSGETGANNETSNITPLSSTPSQPDNIRHRNLIFDSNQSKKETANLNKIVKTNVIQNKKKRLARNTIKKRNNFNKLALNTSIMKKHEIKSNKVEQHFTRQKTSHTTDKPFSCDICNYKCNRKYVLTQHIHTHTGEKPFLCDICDFKCTQKSNLKTHTRIHTKEKPFLCDICNYKCNRKYVLTQHMKTHTGEKPFLCDICYFKSAQKNDLKRHMRTHTKEKPFNCEICGFKCARESALKIHMRIHTKERPFSCDICNYKFTRKGGLVQHMRTHTGDKPFSCNVCDFKCTQKSNLKKHTRIHTKEKPFLCDICNYKFRVKGDLVRHIRTHTGDKPFSCNVCDFKCTQKSNLKMHTRRIHTKEKTFYCDVCDFKSAQISCLKRHILSKHAN